MNKPTVITGEASETDSEDDFPIDVVKSLTQSVQGAVVTGEDTESDNEVNNSIASATSALHEKDYFDTSEVKYDSLFHQKLREQNEQLKNGFENMCQSTINEASKNLNLIDQNLLRSQITLQNAVTSLKTLSINSLMIKSKLHSVLTSNFLSNVTLNK